MGLMSRQHTVHSLSIQSWVRFCQQEFGEFPWPAWAVGSYSNGPPAGVTPQIVVDRTSPVTGRLRVYSNINPPIRNVLLRLFTKVDRACLGSR